MKKPKPGIRGVHATHVFVDDVNNMPPVVVAGDEHLTEPVAATLQDSGMNLLDEDLTAPDFVDRALVAARAAHVERLARDGIGPKRPPKYRWSIRDVDFKGPNGEDIPSIVAGVACFRGRVLVISTLDLAALPDGSGMGPQWHVSISFGPNATRRLTSDELKPVLRDFGMTEAEEDNHEPGRARHFWLPVDPAHRVDCECKTTEEVHTEADGHRWSNPRNATPENCNACRVAALGIGIACPLHGPKETPK